MEPPCSVRPIAEWCILGIEVYSGTGQLSFLSPRGGKYIEIPRGARYHHGVLSFGGTYMEVSFDADVAAEHGVRAAVVLNHIAHLMRFPDGSQAGHFNTCGRAYVHVSPEYLWKMFPFMSLRQATEALRELREGGVSSPSANMAVSTPITATGTRWQRRETPSHDGSHQGTRKEGKHLWRFFVKHTRAISRSSTTKCSRATCHSKRGDS